MIRCASEIRAKHLTQKIATYLFSAAHVGTVNNMGMWYALTSCMSYPNGGEMCYWNPQNIYIYPTSTLPSSFFLFTLSIPQCSITVILIQHSLNSPFTTNTATMTRTQPSDIQGRRAGARPRFPNHDGDSPSPPLDHRDAPRFDVAPMGSDESNPEPAPGHGPDRDPRGLSERAEAMFGADDPEEMRQARISRRAAEREREAVCGALLYLPLFMFLCVAWISWILS